MDARKQGKQASEHQPKQQQKQQQQKKALTRCRKTWLFENQKTLSTWKRKVVEDIPLGLIMTSSSSSKTWWSFTQGKRVAIVAGSIQNFRSFVFFFHLLASLLTLCTKTTPDIDSHSSNWKFSSSSAQKSSFYDADDVFFFSVSWIDLRIFFFFFCF